MIVHHNLPCSRRDLVYNNFEVVITSAGGWNLTLRRLLPRSWLLATLLPLVANATAVYCSLCRSDNGPTVCLCQGRVDLFFEILVGFEPSRHLRLSVEHPGGVEELMRRFMSRGIDSPTFLLYFYYQGIMNFELLL